MFSPVREWPGPMNLGRGRSRGTVGLDPAHSQVPVHSSADLFSDTTSLEAGFMATLCPAEE